MVGNYLLKWFICVLESGTSSEPQLLFLKYSSFNKTFNNTDSLSPRQNLVGLELELVSGDACPRKVASPEATVFAQNVITCAHIPDLIKHECLNYQHAN